MDEGHPGDGLTTSMHLKADTALPTVIHRAGLLLRMNFTDSIDHHSLQYGCKAVY